MRSFCYIDVWERKTLRGIKTSSCLYVFCRVPCSLQYLKTKPKLVMCWGERLGRAIEHVPDPPELSQDPPLHHPFCGFRNPSAVPSNFEKLGRHPCSSLSTCRTCWCLGQNVEDVEKISTSWIWDMWYLICKLYISQLDLPQLKNILWSLSHLKPNIVVEEFCWRNKEKNISIAIF